jgi:hypothetical protein
MAMEMPVDFEDQVINPSGNGDPDCPPEDIYQLAITQVLAYGPGMSFDGKPPKNQFTVEFEMLDYPDVETGEPKRLRGYFTPIIHRTKMESNLFKLLRAINGGEPYPIETDADGELAPYTVSYVKELLESLAGQPFRTTVGPNKNNWARIKGDPLPMRRKAAAPAATRVVSITKPAPVAVADDSGSDDTDENF